MADSLVRALAVVDRGAPLNTELLVIDKLLWGADAGWRRQQLSDAVAGRFSYRHTPPKPCAWQGPQRRTKRDWSCHNNARNTGIALARGQHIILLDDCSIVDELWLLWHTRAAKRGVAAAGSFCSYNTAKIESGIITSGDLPPIGHDSRGSTISKCSGAWLWGLGASFPLSYALRVNGYDEKYDGQGGSDDCDFGVRIERAGCQIVYMPMCLVFQVLTNHEGICGMGKGWGSENPPQKEKLLRDGKMHFANELLIQNLHDEPTRILPVGNDFNLIDLRKGALATGNFPTERATTHDWRDGAKLEDCV